MNKLKSLVKSIWASDGVRRTVHTFWQSFLGVFLLGITTVLSNLLSTHNFSDARSALVALVAAAVAAAFSAVKTALVARS